MIYTSITYSGFNDVSPNEWSAPYITFGARNGWMNGYRDGTFRPDAPRTRAETAKILANAIELEKSPNTISSFVDIPPKSKFIPYIEALKDSRVINGKTRQTFEPDASITRAEVARIIYKTFLGGQR